MNKSFDEIPEFTQSTPPEIPFQPPVAPIAPTVSVPMVYVENREQVEYCVKAFETLEAKQLEAELNALGRSGWWLIQVVRQEKNVLLVFARQTKD